MKRKKRIIVSVTNDLYTDQRVDKVCRYLHENGFQVLLVGRKRRNSPVLDKREYATKRLRLLFEKGALFYAFFNVRLFLFLFFRRQDALLSNDLDALLANYLVAKIKRKKLVYDSHELFTEVPELIDRPRVRAVWLRIEKWIFPKLQNVYTVNDSIAEIYRKRYNVPVNVVRNVSPKWNTKNVPDKKKLGIPENKLILIIQGAGINVDRGAEEAVEAMKSLENTVLLIVGGGDVVPQLMETVKKENLTEKVLFIGKKPYKELMYYTYYADIGLTLDKNTNLNYKYSLPNKVFDYIHGGTAVISSDLIQVRRIVEAHDVGVVISEVSPKKIVESVQYFLDHPEILQAKKENCLKAAKKENWEEEKKVLKQVFEKI
ncbi:MAG: glycosyltransferase [Brumimicrobium sp.]|nr:glycosyltransferase [Brumimicrobium sp.]